MSKEDNISNIPNVSGVSKTLLENLDNNNENRPWIAGLSFLGFCVRPVKSLYMFSILLEVVKRPVTTC